MQLCYIKSIFKIHEYKKKRNQLRGDHARNEAQNQVYIRVKFKQVALVGCIIILRVSR